MTPIQIAALHFVADRQVVAGRIQFVDLRGIGEPMRQRIIDLGMMEPPLVDVDADKVFLTEAGFNAVLDFPHSTLQTKG